jgi:YesN/AraC family two-component response regulator
VDAVSNALQHPRILFVDDEVSVLDGIRRSISIHSEDAWEVIYAASGPEALALMAEKQADVVVTDILMPIMDGKDLIERIKLSYPRTITVILSGHWTQSLAFSEVGPETFFLAKPVSGELLVWTLRRIIEAAQKVSGAPTALEQVPSAGERASVSAELRQLSPEQQAEISSQGRDPKKKRDLIASYLYGECPRCLSLVTTIPERQNILVCSNSACGNHWLKFEEYYEDYCGTNRQ